MKDDKRTTNSDMKSDLQKEANSETVFLETVRTELDASCERLDGHTRSRLNSIRHAALEHGLKQQTMPGRALLAPFGGLVTACVLVVVVSLFYQQRPETPLQAIPDNGSAIEDLDILTSTENLELFENLEFFQWLEENETSV